jgi:glycosyltransferase involved in cell wall biosynthesis
MSGAPLVTVVVPAVNVADVVATQLDRLHRQEFDGPWEIVVADNGSSDATRAVCESWRDRLPHLRVVDASARRGCGAAKNQGVEHARGELVLFCDADDLVATTWVAAHVDALAREALSTGPISVFPDGAPPAGFDTAEFTSAPTVHLGWLPFAFGCNMGARRALLDELGGFDESVVHAEDIDLSWRAQLAGHGLAFASGARVLKRSSADFAGKFRQHHGYGISDTILRRRFRDAGVPRETARDWAKHVAWLGVHLPDLADHDRRRTWAAVAGRRSGMLAERVRPGRREAVLARRADVGNVRPGRERAAVATFEGGDSR